MKAEQSRPIGTDPDGHRGTIRALKLALGGPLDPPVLALGGGLLPDQAADAAFVGMIERLRGEPSSRKRGRQ